MAIPIGLAPGTKALRLEREPAQREGPILFGTDDEQGHWRLWIHANHDFTLGTYLRLSDNGMIERVTLRADEGPQVFIVKPADSEC